WRFRPLPHRSGFFPRTGPARLVRRPILVPPLLLARRPPGRGTLPDSPGRPDRPRRRLTGPSLERCDPRNGAPNAASDRRGRPPSLLLLAERLAQMAGIIAGPARGGVPRLSGNYSDRGCGIPASSARTSVSRYRRWPPRVRIDVSLPAFAHRVTVLGSTRNIVATSAGVRSGSASGVRADMCTASPPGPVLRSCVL